MEMTPVHHAFPTMHAKNVAVPPPLRTGGWWHPDSAPLAGGSESPGVDPTWEGQAHNLVAGGAMVETSYHYPAGGIRPGNNEPGFLRRYVAVDGGSRLALPHQAPAPFSVAAYDTDPLCFNH